jgi:hypothetical protein
MLNRFFKSSLSRNIDKRILDAEVIKLVFECTEYVPLYADF